VGIAVVILLVLVKWIWWEGSIPFLQKKTVYQVDPKS